MKTCCSLGSGLNHSTGVRAALLLITTLFALSGTAHGQIFVTNHNANTISKFNLDGSGSSTLVSGGLLSNPYGIAVSGSFLYVTNAGTTGSDGTVVRYNLDGSGATALISTGLYNPEGIAVAGTNLYVTNAAAGSLGTVFKYNLDGTGGTQLISGLSGPIGIALSGSSLFVANSSGGTVGKYNLDGTGGSTLISGLNPFTIANPFGIAVSGSSLFVTKTMASGFSTIGVFDFSGSQLNGDLLNAGTSYSGIAGLAISGNTLFATIPGYDQIGVYNATSGATSMFINGLGGTYGVAVSAIPEPSTYAAIAGAAMLGVAVWRRRNRKNPSAVAPSIATV